MAAGGRYRRLDLPNLAQFEGVGIYYGATRVEAEFCREEEVAVVGGGNSAGQAAIFLSDIAKHVYLLVRGPCLAKTMSQYLISRIEASPRITLMAWTKIEALEGGKDLERFRWRNTKTARSGVFDIRHVFVMTGADPNTEWLQGCVELDANGFIKTGADVGDGWPLRRTPLPARNQPSGSFRGGRYPRGERETCGLGRGRRIHGRAVRAQGLGGITQF